MTTGDDIELQKLREQLRQAQTKFDQDPHHQRLHLQPQNAENAPPFYAHVVTFQLFNRIAYTQTPEEFYSPQRMEFHVPRSFHVWSRSAAR
jgi:hypothetical protein